MIQPPPPADRTLDGRSGGPAPRGRDGLAAADLALLAGARPHGDPTRRVTGAAGLVEADRGDVSFLSDSRRRAAFEASRAGVVFVPADDPALAEAGRSDRTIIGVDSPLIAFARAADVLGALRGQAAPGVHPTALLGRGVQLGADVAIGPYAVVGEGAAIGARTAVGAGAVVEAGATIGADCVLGARVVVLSAARLGDRVIVHPGAVLGSEGFGFVRDGDAHRKLPQNGLLLIEDDVEIGANTTLDRGSSGPTQIKRGTKIDNLVQVGHNVRIGERCLLAGQAGIAGSSVLDDDVALGGQAGVADHVHVGSGAAAAAQAGITADVPAGTIVSGYPALPHALARRVYAVRKRLPELLARVRALEDVVRRLGETK